MKSIIRWTIQNTVFAALTYYGVVLGVEGAMNVATFIIWFMFFLSVLIAINMDKAVEDATGNSKIPLWVDQIYDVLILCVWIWYGHMLLAILYLFHMFPLGVFKVRLDKKRKEQEK